MAILLLDIDGTLIDFGGSLPASARAAVEQAHERGHLIFLCTGRVLGEIQDEALTLPLDGILAGTGSYLRVGDQVLHHQTLPRDTVDRAIALLQKLERQFYAETTTGIYPSTDMMATFAGMLVDADETVVRGAFPHVHEGLIDDPDQPWRSDVSKLAWVLGSEHDLALFTSEFGATSTIDHWSMTGDRPELAELRVKDSDKGVTVDMLIDHVGIDPSDLIGFGDSRADIPMFERCGTAVVMGQATDQVKAVADLVTGHVADDGLADAFRTLGLI